MASQETLQLIANANIDDLREIVFNWAKDHPDFSSFVSQSLCPAVEDVDFRQKLSQAINRETKDFFSRHEVREATDWGNVYYELIEPWSDHTDALSTEKLYNLIDVIVTEVGMQVTDEDFYGDDWYGDDFSGNIKDIMNVLGNLAGLLLIRNDLDPKTLDSFRTLIQQAQQRDAIESYIGSPYGFILDLIEISKNSGEVTSELFNNMIDANIDREGGAWVCRKIDFIRSNGHAEEALEYMEEKHPLPGGLYEILQRTDGRRPVAGVIETA